MILFITKAIQSECLYNNIMKLFRFLFTFLVNYHKVKEKLALIHNIMINVELLLQIPRTRMRINEFLLLETYIIKPRI